jgi:hypothetical protein
VLVHALQPRVAIMNNGTRKGGAISVYQVLHTYPRPGHARKIGFRK